MATVSRRIKQNKHRPAKTRKPNSSEPQKVKVDKRTYVTLKVGKRLHTTEVRVLEDPQLMLADAVNQLNLQDAEQAVMGYNGTDYTYNRI